ncbi:hypothetical protein ACIBI7_18705 [Nonomuraea fuscirosea]|uniref:hypothetical protein n=1 Tax=Nonomuraea fuscirosea TaxID=1291556 RepID=UPI0037B13EFC
MPAAAMATIRRRPARRSRRNSTARPSKGSAAVRVSVASAMSSPAAAAARVETLSRHISTVSAATSRK